MIYEELHLETKHGGNAGGPSGQFVRTADAAFATATAEATGKDKRTVERAAARGEALGPDLDAVAGTSLDKGLEPRGARIEPTLYVMFSHHWLGISMSVVPIAKDNPDPVAGGFYTVREVARLLSMPNAGVITAWLKGRRRGGAPVINRQYPPIGGVQELGFLDLIEVRFIEHFRKRDYSLQSLRKAAETARAELSCEHPFALYGARFIAERKNIFLSVAKSENDTKLLNLVTKQYAMYSVLEDVLARGISFDPTSGLAVRWRPREKEFPRVVVDPKIAYGQPAIEPARVPTEAVFSLWKAENGSYSAVADWFEIEEIAAREAVEFELSLPN